MTLRFTSELTESIRFKAAISHDGHLLLLIEETPFELNLRVDRALAVFTEVLDGGEWLTVEKFESVNGEFRKTAGGAGPSMALFNDARMYRRKCSGRL